MLHFRRVTNSVAWRIGQRERIEIEAADNNMAAEATEVCIFGLPFLHAKRGRRSSIRVAE
jgi:hypothetical protein